MRTRLLVVIAASLAIALSHSAQVAGQQVELARVSGRESPLGEDYSDFITFDGNQELVADGSISIVERIFSLNDDEFFVEFQFDSTSGGFVSDLQGDWRSVFEIRLDRPARRLNSYFFYKGINGAIDLTDVSYGGEVIPHPFDANITNAAELGTSSDLQTSHLHGIFSNPFDSLTNQLGVVASEVTGFGIGVQFTTVPEPSSCSLLFLLFVGVTTRRRKS